MINLIDKDFQAINTYQDFKHSPQTSPVPKVQVLLRKIKPVPLLQIVKAAITQILMPVSFQKFWAHCKST